ARRAPHVPPHRRGEHRRHPRHERARPTARPGGASPLGPHPRLRPRRLRPAGQGALLPQRQLRADADELRAGAARDGLPPDPAVRVGDGEGRRHRHPAHPGGDRQAALRGCAARQPRRRLPPPGGGPGRRRPRRRHHLLPRVRQLPPHRADVARPADLRPRGRPRRVPGTAAARTHHPARELRPHPLPLTVAASLLVRRARLVPVASRRGCTTPHHPDTVDVLIVDGTVVEVGPGLLRRGEDELDADGRWLVPGLWDQHLHSGQWARSFGRIDLGPARSAAEVVELVSGDVPCGGLTRAALRRLGLPPREGPLREHEWFDVRPVVGEMPHAGDDALRTAVEAAAARGVVGGVDVEFAPNHRTWPERVATGLDLLRVRTGVYAADLDDVLALGLRTGDPLPEGRGLLTMGPVKVITDGALNTRTAFCHEPYAPAAAHGVSYGEQTVPPHDLVALMSRATRAGLATAVHAIGDASVTIALDAYDTTGARGTVEHAQLVGCADLPRFAALGVAASVQ